MSRSGNARQNNDAIILAPSGDHEKLHELFEGILEDNSNPEKKEAADKVRGFSDFFAD
jgi:hypothetical protein